MYSQCNIIQCLTDTSSMNYAAKVSPLRMSCMWISANPKYLRNRDFDKLQQFSLVAFPLLGKNRLIDNH